MPVPVPVPTPAMKPCAISAAPATDDGGTTEAAEGTSGGRWAGEPFPPNPLLSEEHLLPHHHPPCNQKEEKLTRSLDPFHPG